MNKFIIDAVDLSFGEEIQRKIDGKTKPQGSLGQLERTVFKIASIQKSLSPKLSKPSILVFAADHGLAKAGVSAFPQEVTFQMVLNFLGGGAAINVFTRQHGIDLNVIDAGVNFEFEKGTSIIDKKIGMGTENILDGLAMTGQQCQRAIEVGSELVNQKYKEGSNVIGFGEMGIGNTASAALLMSSVCDLSIEDCTGRGTGLDDEGLKRKIDILRKCQVKHGIKSDPYETLATYGGFEIAMIVGAFLQAAQNRMVILVDGFIVTSALLVASRIDKSVLDYCIFSHQSDESGHQKMVDFLEGDPILKMNLRLGEGSGVALAYPLIQSSVNFFNEMASFEEASVSNKEES